MRSNMKLFYIFLLLTLHLTSFIDGRVLESGIKAVGEVKSRVDRRHGATIINAAVGPKSRTQGTGTIIQNSAKFYKQSQQEKKPTKVKLIPNIKPKPNDKYSTKHHDRPGHMSPDLKGASFKAGDKPKPTPGKMPSGSCLSPRDSKIYVDKKLVSFKCECKQRNHGTLASKALLEWHCERMLNGKIERSRK